MLERLNERERRREGNGSETASATRRGVDVPSTDKPADEARRLREDSEPRFQLRKVRTGEERAYRDPIEVACAPGGVQFHSRVGTRVVVAVAKQMPDVELTTYGAEKDLMLACGPRTPPDRCCSRSA